MKIAGIISEYNPFHNGHKYQIDQTKQQFGATHIVAVMSGNYTQRGDVAIIDKYKRAKTALENGVDLVLELPVGYALSSAEYFARGGVTMLEKLGCVDVLSFGSECGNINLLKETAGAVEYASQSEEFHAYLRRGKNYPLALREAISEFYTDVIVETLDTPNNTLAIEYIRALEGMASSIKPVTVKRFGAEHDSYHDTAHTNDILSASQLRKMLYQEKSVTDFLPESDFSNIADLCKLELPILSHLRTMNEKELREHHAVLGDMDKRLYKALRVAKNLNELYTLTKTKRYTLASVRRAILTCFLGIKKKDISFPPPYIKILGMNDKGKEILAKMNCDIPVGTSLKQLSMTSKQALKQALLENRCTDLYTLSLKNVLPCGAEYTQKPIIIKG